MDKFDTFKKAGMYGAMGMLAMMLYTYLAQFMHLPGADMREMFEGAFNMGAAGAWVFYFAFGMIGAYLYKSFFEHRLPEPCWMRGMMFACFLWVFTQMVMMPMMGMGFFAGSMAAAFGMLIGFMFYGATIGYLFAQR